VEVVAVEVVEVVVMVWSWEVTAAMAMVLPPLAVMQVSMEALLGKLVVLVAFLKQLLWNSIGG